MKFLIVKMWQYFHKNIFGYVIPCNDSLKTVSRVLTCPKNLSELEKAIERKSCYKWKHSCKSFEYHCVSNDWTNETIEVCAPSLLIIGGICAEFNTDRRSVRANYFTDCKKSFPACPDSYNSTTSYKYFGCFSNVTERRVTTLQK
ncbi:uncharacterized protein LOC134232574 [Saccostrea cucullata]|uniref:uncharacterized protein LOC134232574 n=1 Tax=Saccostrea cuccullata TaxID=36930 RepID=UPI002ED53BDF